MEIKNLLGLSEPIVKLIECVQSTTGVLYEPTRIRRKAEAEADALLIFAKADIQKNELLQRTAIRILKTETKRQENIDSVVDSAIEYLPAKVSLDRPDNDWLNNFFEECKDVSDSEIQQLWGRILANEVATPGQVSRRTLSILKMMTKVEAEQFCKICSMAFHSSDGDTFIPVSDETEILIADAGISLDDCKELDTLGLVHTGPMLAIVFHKKLEMRYFEKRFKIELPPAVPQRIVTSYILTKPGKELLKVINIRPDYDLIEKVLNGMDKFDRQAIVAIDE
jgi:uncharacterized repeat protein (TIGR03899 family)